MRKPFMSLISATALAAVAFAPAGAATVKLIALTPAAPTAVAAASSAPPCAVPNVPAAISGTAFILIPSIAEGQGAIGTSDVQLSLLPSGKVAGTSLAHSSGNPHLDRAALQSARMTQFTAEVQGCSKVAGTYLYEVDF
jgi:TonB family protein